MEDEILRILKLVEQGKLKPDEAEMLIEALNIPAKGSGSSAGSGGRFLKVEVKDEDEHVNVTLPIGLLKFFKKFIPDRKLAHMEKKGIHIDEIISGIDSGSKGDLVNIEGGDHEKVRIWIE
jgi:hypothetical protein